MSLPVLVFPIAVLSQYFFGITLFLLSLFLILLILVQQGRGGGLTGALGGPGGQSAFGTKAGDVFTKITIIAASIWIVLAAVAVRMYTEPSAASALSNTTINTTSGGPVDFNQAPNLGMEPGPGSVVPGASGSAITPVAPGKETTPAPAVPATEGAVTPGASETQPAATETTTPATQAEVDVKSEAPLTFEPAPAAPEAAPAPAAPGSESAPALATPADGATEQPKP